MIVGILDTMLLRPGGLPGSVVVTVRVNQYNPDYLKLAHSSVSVSTYVFVVELLVLVVSALDF